MESETKATRSKTVVSKTNSFKSNVQHPENKWVWILKDNSVLTSSDCSDSYGDIITLRHPCSGAAAAFLYSSFDNTVQEILSCEDKLRSWFIDESVKSDGQLKLSTPIDPIFLVLPYLRKLCLSRAIPLDQLLCDEEFPKTEILLKCSTLKTLDLVADKKGCDDLQAYKYNEEKTLKWLQIKTKKVAAVLEKKGVGGITDGIASSTFTQSCRTNKSNSKNFLKYAHGIVSDYIEPELSEKLLHHLDLFEEPSVSVKRKSSFISGEAKKVKIEEDENVSNNLIEIKPVEVKPAKQSTKQKLHAKAASSNKSITSYFKKT